MISTILTTLFQFYNTAFQPILQLGPYLSMGIFAAALAALFSLFYYIFLDKEKADRIKEKLNEKQEKMKEAREDDSDEDPGEYMQEMLELNQKFMLTNFKPMIATIFFVALIFPWLSATYAPTIGLTPDDPQNTTLNGELNFANQQTPINIQQQDNTTTITVDGEEFSEGDQINQYGINWRIGEVQQNPGGLTSTTTEPYTVQFAAEFIQLPISLPFAGTALNWLGFYIILSLPLSITFRKLLGVA